MQKPKLSEREIAAEKNARIMSVVDRQCSYYRANPQRFAKEMLNVTLKPFQQILLVEMFESTNTIYIASRGQGKTWLTGLFAVSYCILYPGTRIAVTSRSRRQGCEVLEKIRTIFMQNSPYLCSEIKDIVINQAMAMISFYNGSEIRVVTASDNSRGARANILIVDEFRLVPVAIVNAVLKRFLTAPRYPGYLDIPEYAYLIERNKEIYLSSAWYQSHWSFEKSRGYCANMVNDKKKYFVCGLPYQLSIKEHLLNPKQVEDEMSESDFSPHTFAMEMGALWHADTDGSFYSYSSVSGTRKIKYPYMPPEVSSKIKDPRIKIPPKQEKETRILSIDVALMSSRVNKNDASAIFINFVKEGSAGSFTNNIVYTESFEGVTIDKQAIRVRKLFEEYDCDYLAIDRVGVGSGLLDLLLLDVYDPEAGLTYEALSCCNNDEIAMRCKSPSARKVIWAINGSSTFNSECAVGLRDAIQRSMIRLLIPSTDDEECLQELKGYSTTDMSTQNAIKAVYLNTDLLVQEMVNLDYQARDNVIRVQERSGARKDRYSSLSYNIYVSRTLIREMTSRRANSDLFGSLRFRAPKISRFTRI